MSTSNAILVWPYGEHPEVFDTVITNRDDADWVAFVPECYRDEYIGWMQEGTSFGCCSVNEYEVPGGYIAVGHHA